MRNFEKTVNLIFNEFITVFRDLNVVRQKIKRQKLEITKCEDLIKSYQLALTNLNAVLNQFLEVKANLKGKHNQLLNMIDSVGESDEETDCNTSLVKTELSDLIGDSDNKSSISVNIGRDYLQLTNELPIPTPTFDSREKSPSDLILNIGYFENNKSALHSREKVNSTAKETINVMNDSNSENIENNLKRKNIENNANDCGNKMIKIDKKIEKIYQFTNCQLTGVVMCRHGLIVSGTNGLLQRRNEKNFSIITNYQGYGNETIKKVLSIGGAGSIILSHSEKKLIAFHLLTGIILKKMEFESDISSLESSLNSFFVGTQSGKFYHFSIINYKCLFETQLSPLFVQSSFFFPKSHSSLLGCQNKNLNIFQFENETMQNIAILPENIRNIIQVARGIKLLIISDNSITLFDRWEYRIKSSINFKEIICRVTSSNNNVFVVTSDGTLRIYSITGKKREEVLEETFVYHTYDSSLRDVSIHENQVYLIGESNLYFLAL